MSYEICYEKQFIKLAEDSYLPMFLTGSNNDWDAFNLNKRARSWKLANWFLGSSAIASKQDMLDMTVVERDKILSTAKNVNEQDDIIKHFGRYNLMAAGGKALDATSFGVYQGIVKGGCKYALTIEQICQIGAFSFSVSRYPKSGVLEKYNISAEMEDFYPKTTVELLGFIQKHNDAIVDGVLLVHVGISDDIKDFRTRRNIFFPKIKRTILKDFAYCIKFEDRGYFYSGGILSFKVTPFIDSAKQFFSEAKAIAKAKQLASGYTNKDAFVVVKNVFESPREFRV